MLLQWPGVTAKGDEGGMVGLLCEGNQSAQARNIISAAVFYVGASDEALAKSARAAAPTSIEIGFVYDGKSAADHFACGYHLVHPKPTGLVVAWRMKPAFDWTSAGARWAPPASCDDARAFFGVAAPAPPASVASSGNNDGTDSKNPVLPASDEGFADTRGGWGWGDRCYVNIKAGKWGWAKAECDKGMAIADPTTQQPRASLLYNEGLIAKASGDVAGARQDFTSSLALREHPAVRSALDSLPAR